MNNNIPQGYKESPLGVIPQDWEVRRLGEVCNFTSGGTPSKDNAMFWNGDIPWISAATMHEQNVYKSDLNISEAGLKNGSRLASKGSLLLLVRGSMLWNRIPVCLCLRDVAFNQDVKAIQPNDLISSSQFLLYWFLSNENNLLHSVVGTGIGAGKLETSELKASQIGVPPLAEQERIAEVLGCWDMAIEKQTALVDALTRRKRALMQQLLTARKRLPNFSAPWQSVKLGEVAHMQSGGTPKSDNASYYGGSIHWASISDISKAGKYLTYTERNITEEGLNNSTARVFSTNTVLYAMYASLGKTTIAVVATSTSQAILGITPNNDYLYYEFLYYVLSPMEDKVKTLGQCGTQSNLNKDMVMNFKIKLPSVIEQKAIAQILTTADQEIESAKTKLEALRTQKRGLMQQLLTGKKRLKI